MQNPVHPLLNPLITIAAIAAGVFLLVSQKVIFIPLALGLLFAFFILPATRKLEKHRVPRILANLILIVVSLAVCVGVGMLMSYAISQFASDIAGNTPVIQRNIANIEKVIEQVSGVSTEAQHAWLSENVNVLSITTKSAGTLATGLTKILTTVTLTFIYAFFLLYYRDKLMVFFRKLFGHEDEATILRTLKSLARLVPSYLSGVLKVMLILGLVNTLGFWAIGVPSPIFFGIFAAVLNVIPYAGPIIGFAVVVLFCLATVGPAVALGALLMFLVIQFLENNILTPNIAAGTISVNPFAAIIGIIIGGVMWGVIGMVIALPFLGMIKIICDTNTKWEALGYLIGDEGTDEHALSWKNIKRVFKSFTT